MFDFGVQTFVNMRVPPIDVMCYSHWKDLKTYNIDKRHHGFHIENPMQSLDSVEHLYWLYDEATGKHVKKFGCAKVPTQALAPREAGC